MTKKSLCKGTVNHNWNADKVWLLCTVASQKHVTLQYNFSPMFSGVYSIYFDLNSYHSIQQHRLLNIHCTIVPLCWNVWGSRAWACTCTYSTYMHLCTIPTLKHSWPSFFHLIVEVSFVDWLLRYWTADNVLHCPGYCSKVRIYCRVN